MQWFFCSGFCLYLSSYSFHHHSSRALVRAHSFSQGSRKSTIWRFGDWRALARAYWIVQMQHKILWTEKRQTDTEIKNSFEPISLLFIRLSVIIDECEKEKKRTFFFLLLIINLIVIARFYLFGVCLWRCAFLLFAVVVAVFSSLILFLSLLRHKDSAVFQCLDQADPIARFFFDYARNARQKNKDTKSVRHAKTFVIIFHSFFSTWQPRHFKILKKKKQFSVFLVFFSEYFLEWPFRLIVGRLRWSREIFDSTAILNTNYWFPFPSLWIHKRWKRIQKKFCSINLSRNEWKKRVCIISLSWFTDATRQIVISSDES